LSAVPKRNTLRCTMHRRAQGRTRARGATRERGTRRPHVASRGMFPRNRDILMWISEAIVRQIDAPSSTPPLAGNHLLPPPQPPVGETRGLIFRLISRAARSIAPAPAEIKIGRNSERTTGGRGGGGPQHCPRGRWSDPEAPWRLKLFECCTISEAL